VTQDELDELRTKYIPTWARLRSIGNSRAVQASVAFPVIGYLILLSSQFTSIFDGGVAGQARPENDWWDHLWAIKLYFVYFGLLNLGIGSALYQLSCPRQIKKHGDWEDYVRIDGPVMTFADVLALGRVMGLETPDRISTELKNHFLHRYYATFCLRRKKRPPCRDLFLF